MHVLLIVGVPLIAILGGIFFNNGRLVRMESRVDLRLDKMEASTTGRFDRLESRIDRMQSDLSQFYTILGKHEVRPDVLEKRPSP